MTQTATSEVSTSTVVNVPVERAFHVFTAGIGTWWDESHHILQAPLAELVFEPFVGGHIIDRGTDGSECRWARVLAYEPPTQVVFSWDINLQWQLETDPARTSEVVIDFAALDDARTRVTLTHRHLDRHGEGWEQMRDAVGRGWDLAGFAAVAEAGVGETVLGRPLPRISDATMQQRLGAAREYTMMVLRATDKLVRPAVDATIWEHGRRNMALVEAGLLSVVLPVTDGSGVAGFGVFAASVDETREIMSADPGIRAGIFEYDVHPVRGFPGATLP